MKIGILGAGVIGTLYGWALSERNEVVHIVRNEKCELVDGSVIQMDILDERVEDDNQNIISQYVMHAVSEADRSFDLLIVPVAEQQLELALQKLTKEASETKYLLMTSNWKGMEIIDRYLKKNQYIMGYAGGGGTFRKRGEQLELWGNLGQDIVLGTTEAEQNDLLRLADDLFRQLGIIPEIPGNILHWLWIHNVDSAAIGTGLKMCDEINTFLIDKELVQTCFQAMQEGFLVCEKRGVNLKDFPEVQMYHMPFEQIYPMFRENFETNPTMKRYTAHAFQAIPEMVDYFGQIYKMGKEYGVRMPGMEKLYRKSGAQRQFESIVENSIFQAIN